MKLLKSGIERDRWSKERKEKWVFLLNKLLLPKNHGLNLTIFSNLARNSFTFRVFDGTQRMT